MTTSLPDHSPAIQCRGLIIYHRDHWWLVEFPKPGDYPTRAYLLSGTLSTRLADQLGLETGPCILLPSVTTLRPSARCWQGEFALVPTIATADPDHIDYDVDAHVFRGGAWERDERLAHALIESKLSPIPTAFTSVFAALPDEGVPVLAIRASSYTYATFEVLTARYMPTHHPDFPWRDLSGEAVFASGTEILGWTHASDWIRPR